MENYRIIETTIARLSKNRNGIFDFKPEITYVKTYHVECLCTQFWGLLKAWVRVIFTDEYGLEDRELFGSIEEAKRWIEYREKQIELSKIGLEERIVAKL